MKKIGIVGWVMGNGFGVTLPYMDFFSNFGNVEIISHTETEIRDLDLLVIPGGPDVDSSRYMDQQDRISLHIGSASPMFERFDRVLLPKYIENKTKIFGICRGHQSIYVYMNGKLNQHMYHETNPTDDRNKKVHGLKFSNMFQVPGLQEFKNKLGNKDYKVNSIHHQTVDENFLPENATILAKHEKDDEIEAITYYPDYPIHTVQWHPEQIYDPFAITLINHLLNEE